MTDIQHQSQQVKEALRRAVAVALERKRRLGQYAVIFQNGHLVHIEPEPATGQDTYKL
jgi:hypothetical protein